MSLVADTFKKIPLTDILFDVGDRVTNGALTHAKNSMIKEYVKKYMALIVGVGACVLFALYSLVRFIFKKRKK